MLLPLQISKLREYNQSFTLTRAWCFHHWQFPLLEGVFKRKTRNEHSSTSLEGTWNRVNFLRKKNAPYSRSQISCGWVKKSSYERAILIQKLRLLKIVTSTLIKWFLCYSTTVHMASNCLRTSKVCVKCTPLIHDQKWPPCWKFISETRFNMSRASFQAEDHVMQIE